MSTIVRTSSELLSALKTASAGQTIQVAPGTYSLALNGLNFSSEVTVTSLDPAHPAVFTRLTVSSSSDLAFTNLEIRTDASSETRPFQVASSHDIRFSGLDVHGSLDGNPQNDKVGVLVRGSSDIRIENSEFHELGNGIAHIDDTGLTIVGNNIHDIQTDGIRGGGSSNVTISGNRLADFHPAAGDHPDAIQFWTTNTTSSAHDITITDNVILRGSGAKLQGVFMGNEAHLPYLNVTISGNLAAGTMYNGIFVQDARSVSVTNNVVAGFTDMKSWIYVGDTDGAKVTGNAADQFVYRGTNTHLVNTGNTVIPLVSDGGAAAYKTWLATHDAPTAGETAQTATASTATPTTAPTLEGDGLGNLLVGGAGADTIDGAGGSDLIYGAGGNDVLIGGAGADHLVFAPGGGHDVVRDFGQGGDDTLDISAYLAAGLHPQVIDLGADTKISFADGDSILLQNFDPTHLAATVTGFVFT